MKNILLFVCDSWLPKFSEIGKVSARYERYHISCFVFYVCIYYSCKHSELLLQSRVIWFIVIHIVQTKSLKIKICYHHQWNISSTSFLLAEYTFWHWHSICLFHSIAFQIPMLILGYTTKEIFVDKHENWILKCWS